MGYMEVLFHIDWCSREQKRSATLLHHVAGHLSESLRSHPIAVEPKPVFREVSSGFLKFVE
jgi:hypothetical protein